jgi:hypothetical protein
MTAAVIEHPNFTVGRDGPKRAAAMLARLKTAQAAIIADVERLLADIDAHPLHNPHITGLEWIAACTETIAECSKVAVQDIGR